MANLVQFLNKTNTIDAKSEMIADQLIRDYENGVIKTEVELMYRLKQAIKDFYASVGKPTFKFKPARGTPISNDFNNMVTSACNDMKIIIDECENIADAIKNSFVDAELARQMMFNKMKYIDKKLEDIKNRIVTNNNTNMIVYTDSFTNKDFSEIPVNDMPAFVNTTDGVLTLGTSNAESLSTGSMMEVVDGSNGFPGNTHMVDILNNDLHFIGEQALHIDLNEAIDNNPDTWFEYEMFNVDDKIMEKCNNYGFEYKEGISWVSEDTSLKLKLKITLPNPVECNWLSLTPFIPESKGSKPSFITKCTISDGFSQVQEIKQVKVFDDNTVIIFTPQIVSFIIIEFEQNIPYHANIGHFYFTKTDTTNTLIFDEMENTIYSRVQGPAPSVELLNMQYDPSTKQCIHPKNYNNDPRDTFIDEAYIKKQLFTLPNDTEKVRANKEMLKAYRYCIGIRNVSIAKYSFVQKSVYLSKPFTTNDIITSVTLEADELVPLEFNKYSIDANGVQTYSEDKDISNASSWIKYEISFDNGNNWNLIYPKHRAFQGPCTYKINSEVAKSKRSPNVKYIDKLIEPTSVKLRITLQRPDGKSMASKTPVLFKYRLKILTGGENIEY